MTSFCSNCKIYKWPTEDVPLFCCSNCKFLSYCSSECQKEHWKKVHNKQCKILAWQVGVSPSAHLPDSCIGCNEEKKLGTKTINSMECPLWGCPLGDRSFGTMLLGGTFFQSAVDSGEMTRKFPTRDEHTLSVMQQIVFKIVRSNSKQSQECRTELSRLSDLLNQKKLECITERHLFPANWIANKFFVALNSEDEVFPLMATISRTFGATAGDPFLAMETLKLLAGFLATSLLHKQSKDFERLGMKEDLIGEVQDLVSELDTPTQFEETWDSVLEALKGGLVHHYNLLDILCGGSREQECDQCHKSVIIGRVFVPCCDMSGPKFEKASITFRGRIFSCSEIDCQIAIRRKFVVLLREVSAVMASKVNALYYSNGGSGCDYCFILSGSVRRCSQCQTKVYCSKECQRKDWKLVHAKVCMKGDGARKVNVRAEDARMDELD